MSHPDPTRDYSEYEMLQDTHVNLNSEKELDANKRSFLLTEVLARAPHVDTETFWENSRFLSLRDYKFLLALKYQGQLRRFDEEVRRLVLR